ncbi:hypothetical protein VTI74DRAFT_3123 [Chaetomium olivicolor]
MRLPPFPAGFVFAMFIPVLFGFLGYGWGGSMVGIPAPLTASSARSLRGLTRFPRHQPLVMLFPQHSLLQHERIRRPQLAEPPRDAVAVEVEDQL